MLPRKSVLIVDDSRDYCHFLERGFRALVPAIGVFPIHGGEQAIEHLRACGVSRPVPDLLLLDQRLPMGPNGFDVLIAARALPALAAMPIWMLSASREDEHVHQAKELGADDYLRKPSGDRFMELVEAILARQPWQREEIVRALCVPVAVPVPALAPRVDSVAAMMSAPRNADLKLVEFTAACDFAGITVARCLNLRQTDKILDAKRRLVVRWLLSIPKPLPWGELEVRDMLGFSSRYIQERRAENTAEPLRLCASRALALE